MTDQYLLHTQRAARYNLTPAGDSTCPRELAGHRCTGIDEPSPCVCLRFHRLLDHARTWTDQHGHQVLIGEPYDIDWTDVDELRRELAPFGLDVVTTTRSPWNPGHTLGVEIRQT